jgi:hypothetical protein
LLFEHGRLGFVHRGLLSMAFHQQGQDIPH